MNIFCGRCCLWETKCGTFSGLPIEGFRRLLSGKEGNLRVPSKEIFPTCSQEKGRILGAF